MSETVRHRERPQGRLTLKMTAPAADGPGMSAISSSVGLISGINTGNLIDALINAQRSAVRRLESRAKGFENARLGYQTLEAGLLSLTTSADSLSKTTTFTGTAVTTSDSTALTVTAKAGAPVGTTAFQPIRRASAHVLKSRGFADGGAAVGTGTVTIARGGELDPEVALSALNGGAGVRAGTIRVTDRSGVSADIDLTAARSVRDVTDAINAGGATVTATVADGRLVLTDRSGGTGSLAVRDVAGGQTAADLGLTGTTAADSLSGSEVYTVGRGFALSRINDGNPPRFDTAGADLRVSLADGSTVDVELSAAKTVGDVLDALNAAGTTDDGSGPVTRLTATLSGGRLVLTDQTTGPDALTVANLGGADAVRALGLDRTASAETLTGGRLAAGLRDVLLKNLRGGAGIGTPGSVTLTDRTGATATVDLSAAETLGDVLTAINAAVDDGDPLRKLAVTATVDDAGLGLVLRDSSGGSGTLTVAEVGGGTVAAGLGIAGTGAETTLRSGGLGRRYVHAGTSLNGYGPGGKSVSTGRFGITNSRGEAATVVIDSGTATVGDVIGQINTAGAAIGVTARLNDTGDGFLIEEAAPDPAGTLTVADLAGGKAAADLRIAGTAVTTPGGTGQIVSRQSAVITVTTDDTLSTLATKLGAAGGGLSAQVFDDGSGAGGTRLLARATATGGAARLRIDDGGLGLGLTTVVRPQDALLRIGSEAASGILLASATDKFTGVPGGLEVTVLQARSAPIDVSVSRDTEASATALKTFIGAYNGFLEAVTQLTKFDLAAGTKGVLQGDGTVLRVRDRLSGLVNGRYGNDPAIRSLSDLGVSFTASGKIQLDEERLNARLSDSPQAVQSFFTQSGSGFGVKAADAIKGLTDPLTGTFSLRSSALTGSIESIEKRVTQLDAILEVKRDRLVRQFANLENVLGTLQSQQSALGGLQNLAAQK